MRKRAASFLVFLSAIGACRASEEAIYSGPGEWGESEKGLIIRLETDSTRIAMGAQVEFRLHLHLDASRADHNVGVIDISARRNVSFRFRSLSNDRVYRRDAFDVGMLTVTRPEDIVDLRRRDATDKVYVHLLSDEGNQIPPAAYEVVASYTNDAGETASTSKRRDKYNTTPWKFWRGKSESGPLRIEIVPASVRVVEVSVPRNLNVRPVRGQLNWGWGEAETIVSLETRPGYHLGKRYRTTCYADTVLLGPDGSDKDRFIGWGGTNFSSGGASPAGPWCESASRAGVLRIVAYVELFETSVPVRHGWWPERGDFKVLWSGEIEGSWP
jgi:hypothetical protein